MAHYRVQGWTDLGAGGRTQVFAEGNTMQSATNNLLHLYPDAINVGTAQEAQQPVSYPSNATMIDKLFATAFPNASPGVVFGLGSAAAAFFIADLIATRLTTNSSVTTFVGLVAAVIGGLLGYIHARRLLIICAAAIGIAIFAGLFWHLTKEPNRSVVQPTASPRSAVQSNPPSGSAAKIYVAPQKFDGTTCSYERSSCEKLNPERTYAGYFDPQINCRKSWDVCVRTGRWVGPISGDDMGPREQR